MKKLLIIDDDPIVISSLKMITENAGYSVVATGTNAKEAFRLYCEHQPDIILMDIRMEGGSSIDATKKIMDKFPHARILLITTFEDEEFIKDALAFGARGYILKQNIQTLLPAIEAVLSGNTVLDERIIHNITEAVTTATNNQKKIELSEREEQVYKHIAQGLSNKKIAETLFLSEGTVRNYVSILLEKFEVRDRTQLAISYYKK